MLLVRLTTLALCLSLASCDQYISIAVVDATTMSADNPPPEPRDASSEGGADAAIISDPLTADNSEAFSDGGADATVISNPPTSGNDEEFSETGADAALILNPPIAGNDGAPDVDDCADRPVVAVCDPTKEGTCADVLMQCVVDQAADTPTGICVYNTTTSHIFCFQAPVPNLVESCPETFMCLGGSCREPCLCDGDCSTGRCCGEAIGLGGFKLCADC